MAKVGVSQQEVQNGMQGPTQKTQLLRWNSAFDIGMIGKIGIIVRSFSISPNDHPRGIRGPMEREVQTRVNRDP